MNYTTIPLGLCQCGCGQRTALARQTRPALGYVKGQPIRYINGHNMPRRILVERVCAHCGLPFQVSASEVQRGNGRYCNRVCRSAAAIRPLVDRFWEKVNQSAGPDACWPWMASFNSNGYGQIEIDGKPQIASRVAWELTHGPIPAGSDVCHTCDNPPCCNPAHLFAGTRAENMADCKAKGRTQRGEDRPNARLQPAQVIEIRARAAQGQSQASLAAVYGVTTGAIKGVVRHKTWAHL